jgi:hypothetical protein
MAPMQASDEKPSVSRNIIDISWYDKFEYASQPEPIIRCSDIFWIVFTYDVSSSQISLCLFTYFSPYLIFWFILKDPKHFYEYVGPTKQPPCQGQGTSDRFRYAPLGRKLQASIGHDHLNHPHRARVSITFTSCRLTTHNFTFTVTHQGEKSTWRHQTDMLDSRRRWPTSSVMCVKWVKILLSFTGCITVQRILPLPLTRRLEVITSKQHYI